MTRLATLIGFLFSSPAIAGSITAPAQLGGPEPGSSGPAAAFLNPAGLAADTGTAVSADIQMVKLDVEVTTTRNDGIDPNTQSAYQPSRIDVWVPVFMLGTAWSPPGLDDRLRLGFSISNPFLGGGDYTASEDTDGTYTGHQRYMGVETRLMSVAFSPALGFRVVDGLHVGAGLSLHRDSFQILQASDPFGTEGYGTDDTDPYALDILLDADATGRHLTWSGGAVFDRFPLAQIGLSYSSAGTFQAEGDGSLIFPELLGGTDVPIDMSFEMPLPAIWRLSLVSEPNERLRIGLGGELQRWGECCGTSTGDAHVVLTSTDGDAITQEDGAMEDVDPDKFSPRRLEDSWSTSASVGMMATDRWRVVLGGAYDGSAVPDYALSASNLDFNSAGGTLGLSRQLSTGMVAGLSISKFFPVSRDISNSSWGVASDEDVAYVDDRFSPDGPYRASANGSYSASQTALGLRFDGSW